MIEGHCAGCKHWNQPWFRQAASTAGEPSDTETPRWGTCQAIGLGYPPLTDRNRETVQAPIVAFTQDGSDYAADLHTRDDFGCTLWSENEEGAL